MKSPKVAMGEAEHVATQLRLASTSANMLVVEALHEATQILVAPLRYEKRDGLDGHI